MNARDFRNRLLAMRYDDVLAVKMGAEEYKRFCDAVLCVAATLDRYVDKEAA
jgi:hypothetical protein